MDAQNPDPIPDVPCILNLEIGEGPAQTIAMELEEDIPAELEYFVRLTHFGLLKEAREWFSHCLKPYRSLFPVFLEYADMLYHEGSYEELRTLHTATESADPVGLEWLCNLLSKLAASRAPQGQPKDAIRDALSTALECWNYLHARHAHSPGIPNAIEIHIIEVYLNILVAAYDAQVMHVETRYLNPPWSSSSVPPWHGFDAWYLDLRQHGQFWEAQRILGLLLPVLPKGDDMNIFKLRQQVVTVTKLDEGSFDESLVLSELISAGQLCERYLTSYAQQHLSPSAQDPADLIIAEDYLQISRSLGDILLNLSNLEGKENSPHLKKIYELERISDGLSMPRSMKHNLANYKRIIICADGAWVASHRGNDVAPSNVARIARAIAAEGLDNEGNVVKQIVFYQPGVGNGGLYPYQKALFGGFGWGLEDEVCQLYGFISNNYDPGDELFLFGWSSGASTESQWYATHQHKLDLWDVRIKCVGVWDTVGTLGFPEVGTVRVLKSLGFPVNKNYEFHSTEVPQGIDYAFQALALDERRAAFAPTLWHASHESGPKNELRQCWFPGDHSTIGDNLSGMITFAGDVIDDLVVEHEKLCGIYNGWGCGAVVDNPAGLVKGLAWELFLKKDRTLGDYEYTDSLGTSMDRVYRSQTETFHRMVRVRKEKLPGGYNLGSLDGFELMQQGRDGGNWYWVKYDKEIPEDEMNPDKSMTVSYRQDGLVNYKHREPMSVLLCPSHSSQP
ncbi:hypothetical protein ASPCAL11596 [Aspergillus calidoustus]|uniref:T6SS Phospholipase effector Tle1-like catalytic domain-containing protein n=1 Tax=Aspergillus calidoustus TaxID=454130 RepID=A0A0U5GCP4_ASPCI|nr:hypothetical protein ASPCAL11596 [Aspergillus calidoustus]